MIVLKYNIYYLAFVPHQVPTAILMACLSADLTCGPLLNSSLWAKLTIGVEKRELDEIACQAES